MVANLSRVVRQLKMNKISKSSWKLKLLPFLTESIISFEISSEHYLLFINRMQGPYFEIQRPKF